MNSAHIKDYWEERLSKDYSLSGVGYFGLGRHFNNWMYRVRRRVFLQTLRKHQAEIPRWRILDIGSGTGFYIKCWGELGAQQLTGVDITQTAVQELAGNFPQARFFQEDIGAETCPQLDGQIFDAISSMDVLFHIVEDERFDRALERISNLLKPGGLFVYSDNFVQTLDRTESHQSSRTLAKIEASLARSGFRVLSRKPMFWLMNAPVDSQSRWITRFWTRLEWLVSKHELIGAAVGFLLFPIELVLVGLMSESPTTEIMVCQKL